MKIGDTINYFGQDAEVITFDKTHCVIKLKSGSVLCTLLTTFKS